MGHYRDAHLLARQLLTAQLRTPTHGDTLAWSFLLRTPELIEAGIRDTLAQALAPGRVVRKVGKQIRGTRLHLRPDVVIDYGVAVADIKYKLHDGTWHRPDLYQVTTFAAGYRTLYGALICFDDRPEFSPAPPLVIGSIQLSVLCWRYTPGWDPGIAAADLVEQARGWLASSA